MCAVGEEERAGAGVVELPTIVALDGFHGGTKLSMQIGEEVSQSSKGIKLEAQGGHPKVMRTVVNYEQVIFES